MTEYKVILISFETVSFLLIDLELYDRVSVIV